MQEKKLIYLPDCLCHSSQKNFFDKNEKNRQVSFSYFEAYFLKIEMLNFCPGGVNIRIK